MRGEMGDRTFNAGMLEGRLKRGMKKVQPSKQKLGLAPAIKKTELPEWYVNPPSFADDSQVNQQIAFLAHAIRTVTTGVKSSGNGDILAAILARRLRMTMADHEFAYLVGVVATVAAGQANFERTCRACGCTEWDACEGGCSWVARDLCSACV